MRRFGTLVWIGEGDDFEIGAIGEGDERVVRAPTDMLPTRGDGESGLLVIGRGFGEITHPDNDVIDL